METKIKGPKVKVSFNCANCEYCIVDQYNFFDRIRLFMNCKHPDVGGKKIGESTFKTPDFCPYLEQYENIIKLWKNKEN